MEIITQIECYTSPGKMSVRMHENNVCANEALERQGMLERTNVDVKALLDVGYVTWNILTESSQLHRLPHTLCQLAPPLLPSFGRNWRAGCNIPYIYPQNYDRFHPRAANSLFPVSEYDTPLSSNGQDTRFSPWGSGFDSP